MHRHDDFRHCAHAHGVGAYGMEETVLGWSLERRTLHADINALVKVYAVLFSHSARSLYELRVVGMRHVGESRSELAEVLASQRVVRKKTYVVGDEHHVALPELRIHASGCIGEHRHLYAKCREDSHRECHFLHVVAFVVVEAPLHGQHTLPCQLAYYQVAGVSFDCRDREVRYLRVRYHRLVAYLVGELSQSAAEHDDRLGNLVI